MESIEHKLFDRWVDWAQETAARVLADFLGEHPDWPVHEGRQVKEFYLQNLIRAFADIMKGKTREELEKTGGYDLVAKARDIGEGYVGPYLSDMLKDLHKRKPLLLEPPRGITTEEYWNFLRWVSHQYGRPEEHKGQNFERVLAKIKAEYGEQFPPAVWW